jgi:hypothetical protein
MSLLEVAPVRKPEAFLSHESSPHNPSATAFSLVFVNEEMVVERGRSVCARTTHLRILAAGINGVRHGAR